MDTLHSVDSSLESRAMHYPPPPKPKWHDTWQLILGLWPEWKPTPQTIKWLWERWEGLHQDKLQDAVKQHRMEPSSEKAGRPVYNRINDLYIERTQSQAVQVATRKVIDTAQPLTEEEGKEWDRWAAEIMVTATREDLQEVKQRFPYLVKERTIAVAVDFLRKKRAQGKQ